MLHSDTDLLDDLAFIAPRRASQEPPGLQPLLVSALNELVMLAALKSKATRLIT